MAIFLTIAFVSLVDQGIAFSWSIANVVFVIVIASLLLQGWSIPLVARWLNVAL